MIGGISAGRTWAAICGASWPRLSLRASIKIGELSRELETTQGSRNELRDNDVAKSKAETLEEAGVNIRTAQRYEELAGGKEERELSPFLAVVRHPFIVAVFGQDAEKPIILRFRKPKDVSVA